VQETEDTKTLEETTIRNTDGGRFSSTTEGLTIDIESNPIRC
jgi:hypothetical protein